MDTWLVIARIPLCAMTVGSLATRASSVRTRVKEKMHQVGKVGRGKEWQGVKYQRRIL